MQRVSEKGKALIILFCCIIAIIASIISYRVGTESGRIIRGVVLFFAIVVVYFDKKDTNSNKIASNILLISMIIQLLFQLFP